MTITPPTPGADWDQTTWSVGHKAIDTSFLAGMTGALCDAERTDGWGQWHGCIRLPGHTGRHLALDLLCGYPVAVWK